MHGKFLGRILIDFTDSVWQILMRALDLKVLQYKQNPSYTHGRVLVKSQ